MPSQLSIFELVANASLLVQLVMLLLMVVSVVSWMMIFQKWFLLRRALNEYEAFEDHFWSGIDLRQFYNELESDEALNGIESIFGAPSRLSEDYFDSRSWLVYVVCTFYSAGF